MKLERYEQMSGLIKRFNAKMQQFTLAQDDENIAFITELRNELLDGIVNITDTYIALTSNTEEKYRLVTEQTLWDDAGDTVFVLVDLETGEISLLSDGGYTTDSRWINHKKVDSAYQIKALMPTGDVLRKVGSLNQSEDNLELRLLEYVRNNPSIFNGEVRTR